MKNKKIIISIFLFFLISIISNVNATIQDYGTFKQGSSINLFQTCDNCSYVNISKIISPNTTDLINNVGMNSVGGGSYSFLLKGGNTTSIGKYTVLGVGDPSGNMQTFSYTFEITTIGETKTQDVKNDSILLIIVVVIALLIFLKVSKTFGSMIILTIGMGIVYLNAQNGWMGWIVFACGFIGLIYAILGKKVKKGR